MVPRLFRCASRSRLTGFSLVEILVSIGIISLLMTLLVPAVGRMQDSGRASKCLSNLRQLGVAVAAFAADNEGYTPSGELDSNWIIRTWPYVYPDKKYTQFGAVPELPTILAGTIYECQQAKFDKNVDHKRSYGFNNYLGDFYKPSPDKIFALPKPSMAAMIADNKNESALNRSTINPRHSNKANVLFADGHVAPTTLTPAITDNATYIDPFWGRSSSN